jgi:hypothetical protein
MQQRRLRPGDVLDDYCPRERRITDHAVVAMIEDNIKQTRCVVCDAEHEYKQGRIPAQRRKKASSGLFGQVLEGLQPARLSAHSEVIEIPPEPDVAVEVDDHIVAVSEAPVESLSLAAMSESEPAAMPPPPAVVNAAPAAEGDEPIREDGPVRRPLIRATLPRHEGQVPVARAMPEFTIRQPTNGRGGHRPGGRRRGGPQQPQGGQQSFGTSRFGRGGGGGNGSGSGASGGHRPHGPRGQGQGHGPNAGRPSRRGGKKR